jgi:AefR-like transcriptional repressor, C-terminal domain
MKDTVGVARVTIAEADRFPELSRHLHEAARDRAANAVSQLLNGYDRIRAGFYFGARR